MQASGRHAGEPVGGAGRRGRREALTCLMKSCASLSCSWIHFSSSARKKLKGGKGSGKEATTFGTVLFLGEEIKDSRLFPQPYP